MTISLSRCLIASAVAATSLSSLAYAVDSVPLPTNISVPSVYVIPMKGQMGTDVEKQVYEKIVADVEKVKPDIIVFDLNGSDLDRLTYLPKDPRAERMDPENSLSNITEYRDLVKYLHLELRKYPQIMWVEDAVGWSAFFAFSWPDMYTTSDARIYGLQAAHDIAMGWEDVNVGAKMMAAFTAIGKGFLEIGGYPLELGDALMFPDRLLSASWEGRRVKWSLDNDGTWIVDDNEKATPFLRAQLCEDAGLSDGIADTLDDLVFVLGYREYKKVDSGEKIFDDHVKDWRKALDRCGELLQEIEDPIGVSDEAAMAGKLKKAWEEILAKMERYPAVEVRLKMFPYGITKVDVVRQIAELKERIRQLNQREKDRNRNGGNGAGAGGAGPGGGGRTRGS